MLIKNWSTCPWQTFPALSNVCEKGRSLPKQSTCQVLKSRVGSWRYPPTLDQARKIRRCQNLPALRHDTLNNNTQHNDSHHKEFATSSITSLSITKLSIKTLSIQTFATFSIIKFSITTFSITIFSITRLSITTLCPYAECHILFIVTLSVNMLSRKAYYEHSYITLIKSFITLGPGRRKGEADVAVDGLGQQQNDGNQFQRKLHFLITFFGKKTHTETRQLIQGRTLSSLHCRIHGKGLFEV